MWNPSDNISTFIGCDAPYEKAETVIFGAPFDGTTSYRPGTRFGPSALRSESDGLETYSPYQDKDLSDYYFLDIGDLLLPFGNTEKVLDIIETATASILTDGKRPAMIGGEHLVTLGAMRAVLKVYPKVHLFHFDAHTDLREDYLGEALSHATVIRRVWELMAGGNLYQFGIRSGERYEFEFARAHGHLTPFTVDGVKEALQQIQGEPIYITLDLDVLDPSIFPGTGTPEAGGVSFQALINALSAFQGQQVVGFDMNELSPHYDQSGVSTAVAGKILRELLLITAS